MLSLDSGWWRRHPFERLVSAYCHLFLHGGWRLLEVSCDWWRAVHTSDWLGAAVFSASRQKFVTSLLLGATQSILALHWAPYWYTCTTCHTGDIVRSPDVGTRA